MHESRILVERILSGDGNAFEELVNKYQRLVSHMVFRMIPNETDREDLCQEVFIRVYQNLGRFRFDCKLSTWIAQIAYNRCLNYLEKKKVPLYDDFKEGENSLEKGATHETGPDQQVEEQNISSLVREQIGKLPLHYRTIVTLFHLDEMSYAEISHIMDLPEGTVKSYLFRARQLLKERLEATFRPEELWN